MGAPLLKGIHGLRARLLVGGAAVLALGAQTALAQDDSNPETVVVSAGRIAIAGYQQPTPVTVVGAEQLERDANTDIGDSIRELPALGGSSGPNNGVNTNALAAGNADEDLVNLRNLGILRTLVLVDGQRIVESNITGGVDLSTIPSSIVQRIDVVTGGASAAWGSDAVAGVVNLVLNKNYNGFKANLEASDDHQNIRQSWKAEVTAGGTYLGDRLHVEGSAQYSAAPDTIFPNQQSWFNDTGLLVNPAYTATNGAVHYIHYNNIGFSQATEGGVIVSNPAGTTAGSANILKNIQFIGNGTPAPFTPGITSGLECANCSSDDITADESQLVGEYNNATLFGYASYKVTPDIQVSIQLNYGKTDALATAGQSEKFGTVTIHSDNAFLPASISSIMATNGIPTFMLGTTNENNVTPTTNSMIAQETSLGRPVDHTNRQMYRGVFTVEGALGEDWSWNAYAQEGQARLHLISISNLVTSNFNNSVDAVFVTTANKGTSGLSIGQVACRSTLTNPANGCVPLNVFGDGVASPQAIAYNNAQNDFELVLLNQYVASASIQGTTPWGLPAGRIAVAGGGEVHRETGLTTTTVLATQVAYTVGNFSPFKGAYDVYEGFLEADVPLLKDQFGLDSVDFNAAGRLTDYSTSGVVETWKLGITSQINDDFRVRSTWSYDIRAPDLSELYASGASTSAQGVDPHSGLQVNYFTVAVGNTALVPEASTTISAGVVVTPHWVPGLNFSLDYYSINIKNAIYSAGGGTILAQCAAGVAVYCSAVKFNGPGGALSQVFVEPLNSAAATTSGFDLAADYQQNLFTGVLQLHAVGNYMDEETQTTLGVKTDYAGAEGGDSLVTGGVPKFKATVAATYAQDAWSATVQSRLIGAGVLVNGWQNGVQVDNNNIPFVAYMDLRGSYKWNGYMQFYAAVDNFWNTPPPVVVTSSTVSGGLGVATNSAVYDVIGRDYRIGVRFKF
jgi:outer membrane receptor protein involved in Fe transport